MFSPGLPIDILPSPEELVRFLGKVTVMDLPGTSSHGCWRWRGSKITGTEYGRVWLRNKVYRAHRLSFAIFVGPLEQNDDVHHRCRNEWCINPRHLEAMPHCEHGAHSCEDKLNDLVGVCYMGGPMDGQERRFPMDSIPEFFEIKSYGQVDTYRFDGEGLEYVYDGYRKVKCRR